MSDSERSPLHPERRVENLKESRKAGLTDREGAFLYHVVKLQLTNGWQAVSQEQLYASAAEPNEVKAGNDLSEGMIGQLGTALQSIKWDDEELPYLTGGRAEVRDDRTVPPRRQAQKKTSPNPKRRRSGQEGYTTNLDVFATLPRTVKVAVELKNWRQFRSGYEGQICQADFVEDFSVRFSIDRVIVEKEINFLLRHKYISKYDFPPGYLRPIHRLQLEMEYLLRVEKLFQAGDISATSDAIPQHLSILKPEEVELLMALWGVQHFDPERRGLNVDDIVQTTKLVEPQVRTLIDGLGLGPSSTGTEKDMIEAEETHRDRNRSIIYRIKSTACGWPPTALTICDLIDRQDYPPRREEYPDDLGRRRLHQDPQIIERECIVWPEQPEHGYIEPALPHSSKKIRATRRSIVQRPYLEEVASRIKEWLERNLEGQHWERLADEWRRQQLAKPLLISRRREARHPLTDLQAKVIFTLRNIQFGLGGLAVTSQAIADDLSDVSEFQESEVLKELQYLEDQWPWRIVEPDGLGCYRLAWPTEDQPEGVVSYLDTAFMLVNFAKMEKNPDTGGVGQREIVKHFQQVAGIKDVVVQDAIRFCVGSCYLKRWENEDNYFLTDRVKYEWQYLQMLAGQRTIPSKE